MNKNYLIHLNVQTNSNLSFSLIKIPELVNWAVEKGLKILAIADYYPYDFLYFYNLCKEKKIKPILGVKTFFKEKGQEKKNSVVIYPQNNLGYKSVIQNLFNYGKEQDFFTYEQLLPLSKNCLIIFEANNLEAINYFAQRISSFSEKKDINYQNFYIGFNFFLSGSQEQLAKNIIPLLLPFFSIKMLAKEEETLTLMKDTSFNRYFLNEDVEQNAFHYLNNAEFFSLCTNNLVFYQLLSTQLQTFFEKIELKIPLAKRPTVSKKTKQNPFLLLQTKCWQQLLSLGKDGEEKYQETLKKELVVIEKLNYADYFLVFSDLISYLRKQKIVIGPGRGSAVASLVAYLLEITSVDPLQYGLFFERFLNEKRSSLPDIDLDVEKQEETFKYLREKYGEKNIARIATKQKIGWKNALKESAAVYNKKKTIIGDLELKEILNYLTKKNEANFQTNKGLKIQRWYAKFSLIFKLAEKLQDLFFNSGIHPAGIVISEKTLSISVPLKKEKDFLVSFYSEEELALLGLKKYDFLSLTESLSLISKTQGLLNVSLPSYQEVNLQDLPTWHLLNNSLLTGIFQLDTFSSHSLWKNFRAENFADLILFLALNRPGARINAEIICQQRQAKKNVNNFISAEIKEILQSTYGFIVFEEQVSQIWAFCTNCSFAEAEIKRRELFHAETEKKEKLKKEFLEKSQGKITAEESEKLWQQISNSKDYTFNKAHAVAYAYLCYYIAYLKANYFSFLITHFLNQGSEKTFAYLQEAFFYGYQIEKPDINYSEIFWTVKGRNKNVLFMGFANLKNFPNNFFQAIINEREQKGIYKNWENFLIRTASQWKEIELKDFQNWIKGGLFRSLKLNESYLMENCLAIFHYSQLRQKFHLVGSNLPLPLLDVKNQGITKENIILINQSEHEIFGYYLSYFKRWKKITENDKNIQIFFNFDNKILQPSSENIYLNIYAIIVSVEKKSSNVWLTLQDVRSSLKVTIPLDFYQTNEKNLVIHNEMIFSFLAIVVNNKLYSLQIKKIIPI